MIFWMINDDALDDGRVQNRQGLKECATLAAIGLISLELVHCKKKTSLSRLQ
jgi:hypothetical protein